MTWSRCDVIQPSSSGERALDLLGAQRSVGLHDEIARRAPHAEGEHGDVFRRRRELGLGDGGHAGHHEDPRLQQEGEARRAQRVDAVDAPHPLRLPLRLGRAPRAPAPVADEDEHHAGGQLHHHRARRRVAVGNQRLPARDEHGDGDDRHQGDHPAQHVAQPLPQAALGRQQQDHRGERDGLQGHHEPDQEQVKQQWAPPIGQVGANLHDTSAPRPDSSPPGRRRRVVALPRATTRAVSPALPPSMRNDHGQEAAGGSPPRSVSETTPPLRDRRPSSMPSILAPAAPRH